MNDLEKLKETYKKMTKKKDSHVVALFASLYFEEMLKEIETLQEARKHAHSLIDTVESNTNINVIKNQCNFWLKKYGHKNNG